jgi:hypothetical protein
MKDVEQNITPLKNVPLRQTTLNKLMIKHHTPLITSP